MSVPLSIDAGRADAGAPRPRDRASRFEAASSTLLERLPRRLLTVQLVAMTLIGTLHVLFTWPAKGTYSSLVVRLFDVDREMNLPTWFASTQWLLLGVILAAIAVTGSLAGEGRLRVAIWSAAAVGACYFSLDEVAVLHERMGTALESVLSGLSPDAALRGLLEFRSYYWPLVYGPIFLPIGIGLVVFVWKTLGRARRMALLGIFVFVYAAVGLDLIEGRFGTSSHGSLPVVLFSRDFTFDIFLLEELLEMLGVALVSTAFLHHLAASVSGAREHVEQ